MQVQAVVTLELNRVLGSSHEERQALGELQVLPEQHRAQPEGTGNFCLWLLFLHFQLVLSSCVQTLPRKQPWEEVETASRTGVQGYHDEHCLLLLTPLGPPEQTSTLKI